MSRIIITDVHGMYDELMELMSMLPKNVPVTFGGDLIDRGPKSSDVVEFVKNGGYDVTLGNHEDMMLTDLHWKEGEPWVDYYHSNWAANGGLKALQSYEDNHHKLRQHYDWLAKLPLYKHYTDEKDSEGRTLLVSHASAVDAFELSEENPQFRNIILWTRDPLPSEIPGVYNVFGHTPQQDGATVMKNFACVDGGAYIKRQPFGRLIALQWPEMIIYSVDTKEIKNE